MITYTEEKFGDFLEELKPLLPDHYDELSVSKSYPLSPDFSLYLMLQDKGNLICVTCRDDGVLVGYIIFIVQPHLHYTTCLTAIDDVYFVKKEYRTGRTGLRLFQKAEDVLKAHGVQRIIISCKVHLDHSNLFEYMGYKNIEKVYDKVL